MLVVQIAEAFNCKIFIEANRRATFRLAGVQESLFALHPSETRLHVCPKNELTDFKAAKLDAERPTVCIIPSGWTLDGAPTSKTNGVHRFEYSDHSSYSELVAFFDMLKPQSAAPIVKARNTRVHQHLAHLFSPKKSTTKPAVPASVLAFMDGREENVHATKDSSDTVGDPSKTVVDQTQRVRGNIQCDDTPVGNNNISTIKVARSGVQFQSDDSNDEMDSQSREGSEADDEGAAAINLLMSFTAGSKVLARSPSMASSSPTILNLPRSVSSQESASTPGVQVQQYKSETPLKGTNESVSQNRASSESQGDLLPCRACEGKHVAHTCGKKGIKAKSQRWPESRAKSTISDAMGSHTKLTRPESRNTRLWTPMSPFTETLEDSVTLSELIIFGLVLPGPDILSLEVMGKSYSSSVQDDGTILFCAPRDEGASQDGTGRAHENIVFTKVAHFVWYVRNITPGADESLGGWGDICYQGTLLSKLGGLAIEAPFAEAAKVENAHVLAQAKREVVAPEKRLNPSHPVIGDTIELLWPGDGMWYPATVIDIKWSAGGQEYKHLCEYFPTNEAEVLDNNGNLLPANEVQITELVDLAVEKWRGLYRASGSAYGATRPSSASAAEIAAQTWPSFASTMRQAQPAKHNKSKKGKTLDTDKKTRAGMDVGSVCAQQRDISSKKQKGVDATQHGDFRVESSLLQKKYHKPKGFSNASEKGGSATKKHPAADCKANFVGEISTEKLQLTKENSRKRKQRGLPPHARKEDHISFTSTQKSEKFRPDLEKIDGVTFSCWDEKEMDGTTSAMLSWDKRTAPDSTAPEPHGGANKAPGAGAAVVLKKSAKTTATREIKQKHRNSGLTDSCKSSNPTWVSPNCLFFCMHCGRFAPT